MIAIEWCAEATPATRVSPGCFQQHQSNNHDTTSITAQQNQSFFEKMTVKNPVRSQHPAESKTTHPITKTSDNQDQFVHHHSASFTP
jgi:hypothetical protein